MRKAMFICEPLKARNTKLGEGKCSDFHEANGEWCQGTAHSATASRGWGELRAEGERCSQSGKQNSFISVSVSRSRLVIFRQADKQKICESESPPLWRISTGHMSSPHGPARWWLSENLHECLSVCGSISERREWWGSGRLPMYADLLRAGW